MLAKFAVAIGVAALITASPLAAQGAGSDVTSIPAVAQATADPYTPNPPDEPSLAGSVLGVECVGDVPWINFNVELSDPDGQATNHTATLVITDGSNVVEVPLGVLVNNSLSGRVIWPGASVDAQGNASGWPGWAFVDGAWVETDGNFAWTRGAITAIIRVNPEISVPISYPRATVDCATGPRVNGQPLGLAVTGGSFDMMPLAIAGGGIVLIGVAAMIVARRRSAKTRG